MAVRFVPDRDVLIDLFAGGEPGGTVIRTLLEMELAGPTSISVDELNSGYGPFECPTRPLHSDLGLGPWLQLREE